MKKIIIFVCLVTIFISTALTAFATETEAPSAEYELSSAQNLEISAKSAILIDAATGEVLYEKDSGAALAPASVTKVMTLLLVCEALESGSFSLTDTVSISDTAASMGGSQIFLKEGERMTVSDLLKSTVIASANDAAVALAELTAGSESLFVAKMNKKAEEMGLTSCHFENVTGLDDTVENHVMSASDIAKISRELIKYPIITEYASVWQDTVREGEFTLTNTNRLVRYYDGCNGLKTGSTDKAGYCVSASAKRGNMQLIAVIMGAPTKDARNTDAKALLDFGFSDFSLFEDFECELEVVPVKFGKSCEILAIKKSFLKIINKTDIKKVEAVYEIPESLKAPIKTGEKIGTVRYKIGEAVIGECDIVSGTDVSALDFPSLLLYFLKSVTLG